MSLLHSTSSSSSAKSRMIFLHSVARSLCAHHKMCQLPSLYGSCLCTFHQPLTSPRAFLTINHTNPQDATEGHKQVVWLWQCNAPANNGPPRRPKGIGVITVPRRLHILHVRRPWGTDSKKISGSTPKTTKTCRNRWNWAHTSVTFIYTRSERISRLLKGWESSQDLDGTMPRRSSQPQTRCGMPTSRWVAHLSLPTD